MYIYISCPFFDCLKIIHNLETKKEKKRFYKLAMHNEEHKHVVTTHAAYEKPKSGPSSMWCSYESLNWSHITSSTQIQIQR